MKNNIRHLGIFVLLAGIGQSAWCEPQVGAVPAAGLAAAAVSGAPEAAARPVRKATRKGSRKTAAAATVAKATVVAASAATVAATTPPVPANAGPAEAPLAAPVAAAAAALPAPAVLALGTKPAEPPAAPAATPAVPPVTAPATTPAVPAAPVTASPAAPGDAVGSAARRPGAAPTAAGLTQRWQALDNLFERSSAAQHIEHEGSPESKQLQQEARAARAKAKQAIDAGELEKADGLLREASQLMFKAERASRSPAMAADKAKTDYLARRNSVQALMQTGRRIAGEEHKTKPEFAQADGLIKQADKLADEGKHAEGRVKLDQAYGLITSAVRGMREGITIRADKNFANKAEEYKYEQSRNDDYRGLIAGIVEGQDSSWTDVAKESLKLRDEADRLAGNNEHEAALKKINESTNKLKALLRRSGFPII